MMLVTDDRDPMTFEETCLLLEGVRNPRIMRDDVEKYLSELVSELVHGVKARDISVVKYIIPLIPELRQMLLDTVNDFFDLPLSEHDRRRKLLAEEAEWNRKHHPDYFEMSPEWQAAYAARYAPVEATIARLSLDGWKRNAVFFINNPLEMVRNVVAAECLRRVPGDDRNRRGPHMGGSRAPPRHVERREKRPRVYLRDRRTAYAATPSCTDDARPPRRPRNPNTAHNPPSPVRRRLAQLPQLPAARRPAGPHRRRPWRHATDRSAMALLTLPQPPRRLRRHRLSPAVPT